MTATSMVTRLTIEADQHITLDDANYIIDAQGHSIIVHFENYDQAIAGNLTANTVTIDDINLQPYSLIGPSGQTIVFENLPNHLRIETTDEDDYIITDKQLWVDLRGGDDTVKQIATNQWAYLVDPYNNASEPLFSADGSSLSYEYNLTTNSVSTEGNFAFVGGNLNDKIISGGNDDRLYGNEGDDYINAGEGDDEINGDAGNDTLIGGPGSDKLRGGAGDDSLYGYGGSDNLYGGDGDDTLDGGDGDDTIYGGDGDDQLEGGTGNNVLTGGLGSDTYFYAYQSTDTVFDSGGSNDTLYVTSRDQDNVAYFGDSYVQNGNLVLVSRQDSSKSLTVENAFTADGRIENITFHADSGAWEDLDYRISSLDDNFTGENILYFGTRSDDILVMNDGYNEAVLSAGNDTVTMGDGGGWVFGGDGDDIVTGGDGNDYILGEAGDDVLSGWMGNDKIYGGAGDDIIINTGGEDLFDGGDGVDTLITNLSLPVKEILGFSNWNFDIVLDLGADDPHMRHYGVNSNGENYAWDEVYSIENYTLIGDFNAQLTGDGNDNLFITDTGNDILNGGAGNDELHGGKGKDTLEGGKGKDTLEGGSGKDTLEGGAGKDKLYGGNGNDLLKGGAGRDILKGDAGKDTMFGGSGADTFVFKKTSDSKVKTSKADVIKDFEQGKDHIDLSAIDASANLSGNNAFTFDGTQSFGTSKQGDIYYEKFNNDGNANDYTMVYIDTDNDSGTEMSIKLMGLHNLTADDFIL